jgi:transposase
MSRSTVREYLDRAKTAGVDAATAAGMTDEALEAALFPPVTEGRRPLPDWGKIDEELRRHKHVTRELLWREYPVQAFIEGMAEGFGARSVHAPGASGRRSGTGRLRG